MLSLVHVLYIIVWYGSSTFYVTQVAKAADGQHIGVHILAHAVCYAISNYGWDVLIKKKPVDASVFVFSMAGMYHVAGTAAALCGIWYIDGATTQMIKLLEPVIVLMILGLQNKQKAELTHRQYLGSLIVLVTVVFRLLISPTFVLNYFLFALVISIWYPLRNTVWSKDQRLSSANWSLVVSFGLYISASLYFGDLGAVNSSVVYPACLFGTYQLSSLLVLDAVEPQMHSTLNVGKRCFVILGLFFLSRDMDVCKFLLYSISLVGAALLSCEVSKITTYGSTALCFLALLFVINEQKVLFVGAAVNTGADMTPMTQHHGHHLEGSINLTIGNLNTDTSNIIVSFRDPSLALCGFQWGGHNFGDDLSFPLVKTLIQRRLGKKVEFDLPMVNFANGSQTNLYRKNKGKCLITLGSILELGVAGDYVWGTGSREMRFLNPDMHVLAVRGPDTLATVERSLVKYKKKPLNYKVAFGDPGILVHRLHMDARTCRYGSPTNCAHKFCFVKHGGDSDARVRELSEAYGIKAFSPYVEWAQMFRQMETCEFLLCRSLHCIIVADAIKTPSVFFQFPNNTNKEPMHKYHDYYKSVGVNTKDIPYYEDVPRAMAYLQGGQHVKIHTAEMVKDLVEAFPFYLFKRSIVDQLY